MGKHTKVEHNNGGDERFQNQNELALRNQVGLASLVNQLRDFSHRLVHRQVLQVHEDCQSEPQTEQANHDSAQQQPMPIHAANELD